MICSTLFHLHSIPYLFQVDTGKFQLEKVQKDWINTQKARNDVTIMISQEKTS